jgi:acetolactate synthase I/II/III large subunit
MKVIDAIAEIMKREGVQFLSCYPTTPIIEACAAAGIRPYLCRQERVGAGIADGYSRVTNGKPIGVFAMQYGPGAENAFPGVATAYSDSTPMLVLPLGHQRDRAQVFPLFSSARTYASVTKSVETLNLAGEVSEVMRRAFNLLKMGRPGPVMVEIPADVALEEIPESALQYTAVKATQSAGNPADILEAARVLLEARSPVIHAGQGVLYAEATDELMELAQLLEVPVMTTLEGKSAFPENHALALGSGSGVMSRPVVHFLRDADVLFAVGTSLTKHGMATTIPSGKIIIHATNDERDLNKNYETQHPILGDAKLVLRQFIDALKELHGGKAPERSGITNEITRVRDEWLKEWMPKLSSDEVPLNPYRIMWDFMQTIDAKEAIVTHDSGSPRDQLMPFYRATAPRSYLGWGKSHALGTGLGLIMGAKLAAADKFCVNFMGDAAFGMTGLDFETAVRTGIPITTIVLNNSAMAIERHALVVSHERYRARDIGGNYADMGRAMGGYAERIEKPDEIVPAIRRARQHNEAGRAVLLEFITSQEINFSHRRAF